MEEAAAFGCKHRAFVHSANHYAEKEETNHQHFRMAAAADVGAAHALVCLFVQWIVADLVVLRLSSPQCTNVRVDAAHMDLLAGPLPHSGCAIDAACAASSLQRWILAFVICAGFDYDFDSWCGYDCDHCDLASVISNSIESGVAVIARPQEVA